jgi:hypothetical protein
MKSNAFFVTSFLLVVFLWIPALAQDPTVTITDAGMESQDADLSECDGDVDGDADGGCEDDVDGEGPEPDPALQRAHQHLDEAEESMQRIKEALKRKMEAGEFE